MDWLEDYNIGIEEIDNEHRKIAVVVDEIKTAVKLENGKKIIVDTMLPKLMELTKLHFENEENIMKNVDYPLFEYHKKEHDLLLKKLNEIYKKLKYIEKYDCKQIYYFITQWMISHILFEDKKIGVHYFQSVH